MVNVLSTRNNITFLVVWNFVENGPCLLDPSLFGSNFKFARLTRVHSGRTRLDHCPNPPDPSVLPPLVFGYIMELGL